MGTTRQRRPGGRSARVRTAVHAAVLTEIAEVGFGRLSVESVATRAGGPEIPVPDTGSVRGDLRALMHAVVATITSPRGAALVHSLVAEADHSPELRELARRFWATRFALVRSVLSRGVERGELAADLDLVLPVPAPG